MRIYLVLALVLARADFSDSAAAQTSALDDVAKLVLRFEHHWFILGY